MAELALTGTYENNGVGIADLEGELIAAAATTLTFSNSNDRIFVLINNDASSCDVTVNSVPTKYGDLDDTSRVLTVAAGDVCLIPFFSTAMFNSASTGKVTITLEKTTSQLVGIFKLNKTL